MPTRQKGGSVKCNVYAESECPVHGRRLDEGLRGCLPGQAGHRP